MPLIKAFRGLRPVASRAVDVVAPPYDVVSAAEARTLVAGRPWSFLHISRPEVDLAEDVDPYSPEVYAKAAENLQHMLAEGVLVRDPSDCYYVYRLTMGEHVQTGLVAVASVAAYDTGRIRKHELTRPVKEDDRVRQIEALNAQTGPVFLVYRADRAVDDLLAQVAGSSPGVDVIGRDGVRHQLWVVDDVELIDRLTQSFDTMEALYVADGHHRSAAASRVAAGRYGRAAHHTGEEAHSYFLSVVFPHDQMQILDYNRLVRDLHGETVEGFLARVAARFRVEPSAQPVRPARPAQFGMYLDGRWYRLELEPERVPWVDPVARLDVSLLTNELIQPLLGIKDPRRDDRIDFVGGIRGLGELARRVDSGAWALAFSLRPTRMVDLMAVADAGKVMPPKSTWFEPKLADGLVSHILD